MKEWWKRLVKSVYKKEGRLGEFERGYEKISKQKLIILSNFGANKLEDLLEKSTKNVAQEVVSILIKLENFSTRIGVLSDIETTFPWLKVTSSLG